MSLIDPVAFLETHGATIMLSLLAGRWLWSIYTLIKTASATGRSAIFDAICLLAYLAGLAHFRASAGAGWATEPTALFYFANLALIIIDMTLLMRIRALERSFGLSL